MTYNGFGEMATDDAAFNSSSLYSASYAYDLLGRIIEKEETVQGVTNLYEYSYDDAGRLVQVDKNAATEESYSYDSNSNRLSATVSGVTSAGTYDDQDRLLTYGGATYTYSENGELLTKTEGSDVTTYDYDEFGNLRSVTLPDTTVIEYIVDPLDRRIGRKIDGSFDKGWIYQDGLNPVAELDALGNVTARFVYGLKSNVPDYIVKGGNTYRVVSDHLGSVRLVVDTISGSVAQRMDYDSFGRVTLDTNPGFQPFGYAGGVYDGTTGLVRFFSTGAMLLPTQLCARYSEESLSDLELNQVHRLGG